MSNQILVWVEQYKSQPASAAWEAIAWRGRWRMGWVAGDCMRVRAGRGGLRKRRSRLARSGDAVRRCNGRRFSAEPYVALLAKLVKEQDPAVVLMAATSRGRDLAGGLAAELSWASSRIAPVSAWRRSIRGDAADLCGQAAFRRDGDGAAGGRHDPQRAFPKPEPNTSRAGQVTNVPPVTAEDAIVGKVVEWSLKRARSTWPTPRSLSQAGAASAAGRVQAISDLAAVLGAAVAHRARRWTRAGFPMRTRSPDRQDRQPGHVRGVRHLGRDSAQAGMRTAGDRRHQQRPRSADLQAGAYGAVGDLFKLSRRWRKSFKKRLGASNVTCFERERGSLNGK